MSSVARAARKASYLQKINPASAILQPQSRPRVGNSNSQLAFSTSSRWSVEGRNVKGSLLDSNCNEEVENLESKTEELKQNQVRTPWHREGADVPPVRRLRSAGAMVKGKLLTTPSRLLKLTLPLVTTDHNSDRKDIEPLALLVHPHQPLSYLERLIQSELPTIKDKNGNEKIPSVHFRAEDSQEDEVGSGGAGKPREEDQEGLEEFKFEDETQKTGILKKKDSASPQAVESRDNTGKDGVQDYNRPETKTKKTTSEDKFVRWSSSTEVGDFIRDAARGKEFAVEIEGSTADIRVGVPSFQDRTHYLRQRLRRISDKMSGMASIKHGCDKAAHRSAQNIAMGGFAGLVSWWGLVYYLTFKTDLGWDVMEPVTYLVGLSGLMGGYLFFLYHNREVSYRSALNMTISSRQVKLYKEKGFDLERWESLLHEGNDLRKEIKIVADEYDVEWNEQEELDDATVIKALRKDREKNKSEEKEEDKKEDDDLAESTDGPDTKK